MQSLCGACLNLEISNHTYTYCLIMGMDRRVQKIQNLIFSTESILDRDILNKNIK